MALARICSECSNTLDGRSPQSRTCSDSCRQKRARRLRKANIDARALEETRSVRDLVRASGQDAIQEAMQKELAPIVREAIDESVLQAIDKMVKLTTRAVEVLAADLESEDKVMRQRAASLVVKYTVGHPALVRPADEAPPKIEVHFSLPRPENDIPHYDEEGDVVSDEKICDSCGESKSSSEFVAGSERCQQCFDEGRAKIREQFGL